MLINESSYSFNPKDGVNKQKLHPNLVYAYLFCDLSMSFQYFQYNLGDVFFLLTSQNKIFKKVSL